MLVELLLAGLLEAGGLDGVNEVSLGTAALDEFGSSVVIATSVGDDDPGLGEGELVLGGGLVVVRVLIGAVDDGVDIDLVSADRLGDRAPDVGRSYDVNLVRASGRAGSRVWPGIGAACYCEGAGADSCNGQKTTMHVVFPFRYASDNHCRLEDKHIQGRVFKEVGDPQSQVTDARTWELVTTSI